MERIIIAVALGEKGIANNVSDKKIKKRPAIAKYPP